MADPDDYRVVRPARRTNRWAPALLLLVLVLIVAISLFVWRREVARLFAEPSELLAAIRGAGAWGPLLIVALTVAQVILAPIPGQGINFAAGYLYGFWLGTLCSWLGSIIGSTLAMAIARFAGRPLVLRLFDPADMDRIDRLAAGKGLGFFFLVFLLPFLPDDLTCFLAGLTPLPLPALVLTAAIGRIPGIAAATWAGSRAEDLGTQGWLLMAGLIVAALLAAWRWGARIQDWLLDQLHRRT